MELGKQIKKYRNKLSLSQDGLAERIYVSRQTISNWENDKSYPDVNSLILLSEVFQTSIDDLIKGDVEVMRKKINEEDVVEFKKISNVFAILLIVVYLSFVPLLHFLKIIGGTIWFVIWGGSMYVGIKLEKMKKKYDIHTYKEIVAFAEGTQLDEIEKAREEGKRVYQKFFIVVLCTIIVAIITTVAILLDIYA